MAEGSGNGEDAKTISAWTPEDTAQLASTGDTEAARDILTRFFRAADLTSEHDWPSQIPWAFVRYIAEGFRKITEDGIDAQRALGLKEQKAGRPPGTKTHDEIKLGARYWLHVRRGRAPEEANSLVQTATGADRTTVQKSAQACSAFQEMEERYLVAFLSDNSPD